MDGEANLRTVAVEAMDRLSVPGAAIGIRSPEGIEITCLGVAALDTGFIVRPDTLFQVGSVSKPFTASLLVAMAGAGDVDLDAPVTEYVPGLRLGSQAVANRITTRHLLTHQAGFWGDWFDDFGLGDDAMERFVAEYGRLPQMFEPGTMWAYNNCGYILAGLVAARVSGTTFDAALKNTILQPLGLEHTHLSAAEAIAYPVAVGHTNAADDGSARIARQFLRPRARNPAGGVLSSIEDILTFASLHLGKRQDVLSKQAVQSMHEPQVETYEANTHWGLGFKLERRNSGVVVGHGGATNGFRADLSMVPDREFAVAVLTNSDSGSQFATEIVDWVLEQRLGITPIEQPRVALASSDAALFEGVYAHPYASIEIRQNGEELCGRITTFSPYSEVSEPQAGKWFGLEHVGDDRFLISAGELKGAQTKFWRNDDGSVRYLQAGGRLYVPGSWDNLEGYSS
ncbi:MAG: serine hydrolase domain-containing protein [Thermomicrobiales bacterium]